MRRPDLRFDNPNNSCHSLRTLAELIRSGAIAVTRVDPTVSGNFLCLSIDLDFGEVRPSGAKKA